MLKDQNWFEMHDLKRRTLTTAAWIPLLQRQPLVNEVEYGFSGHEKSYFGAVAVLVDSDARDAALEEPWSAVSHAPWGPWVSDDGAYHAASTYQSYRDNLFGEYLVVEVQSPGAAPQWHLSLDLVTALSLIREGDAWLRPSDEYIDVVRLDRDAAGKPVGLKIRTSYLRDYLCARSAGLLVATFQSRQQVVEEEPSFNWTGEEVDQDRHFRWIGLVQDIHEGGFPFGEEIAVFHAGRVSVDHEEDAPTLPAIDDDQMVSNSWTLRRGGKKLFRVAGEMWRNEWVAPADTSPYVLRQEAESAVGFIVDPSGEMKAGSVLDDHRGWLWFRPTVVSDALKKRGGSLGWYTENTGSLSTGPGYDVHFGVNPVGLVVVMASDIAELPELHQRTWAAHNVLPEGGLGQELHAAQNLADPATTEAPESALTRSMRELRQVSAAVIGRPILRQHPDEALLLQHVHRFQEPTLSGLCSLAKELTRLVVEQLDVDLLKRIAPPAEPRLGSIKSLENYLTTLGADGRSMTKPLAGVYELRLADAHLTRDSAADGLTLLELSPEGVGHLGGMVMIHRVADCLSTISRLVAERHQLVHGQGTSTPGA